MRDFYSEQDCWLLGGFEQSDMILFKVNQSRSRTETRSSVQWNRPSRLKIRKNNSQSLSPRSLFYTLFSMLKVLALLLLSHFQQILIPIALRKHQLYTLSPPLPFLNLHPCPLFCLFFDHNWWTVHTPFAYSLVPSLLNYSKASLQDLYLLSIATPFLFIFWIIPIST